MPNKVIVGGGRSYKSLIYRLKSLGVYGIKSQDEVVPVAEEIESPETPSTQSQAPKLKKTTQIAKKQDEVKTNTTPKNTQETEVYKVSKSEIKKPAPEDRNEILAPPDTAPMKIVDPEKTISIIQKKFKDTPKEEIEDVYNQVPESIKGKEAVVEWIVQSLQNGSGIWPEDLPRFLAAFNYFKQNQGNQKFKAAIESDESGKKANNLLDFDLHSLEDIEDQLKPKKKISNREEKREAKVKGSSVFYNEGPYKVIQIGGDGVDVEDAVKAACIYGENTKWCTASENDPQVTKGYLKDSPLYILFDKGEKIAQLHPHTGQLMNLRDKPLRVTPEIKKALAVSGLLNKIWQEPTIEKAEKYPLPPGVKPEDVFMKSPGLAASYASNIMKKRWPEAEELILQDRDSILNYATTVVNERWPEAEATIEQSPGSIVRYSDRINKRIPRLEEALLHHIQNNTKRDGIWLVEYAKHVMKKRWPEAEPIIAKNPGLILRYCAAIHTRIPSLESIILDEAKKDPYYISSLVAYANDVIKGRWPEAEPIIAKNGENSYFYSKNVVNGRFILGEPAIQKEQYYRDAYNKKYETRKKGNIGEPQKSHIGGIPRKVAFHIPKGIVKEGTIGDSTKHYGHVAGKAEFATALLKLLLENKDGLDSDSIERLGGGEFKNHDDMSYNRRIRTLINRGLIEATKKKPANGGRSRSIYKITSLGKRLLKIKTKKAEGK